MKDQTQIEERLRRLVFVALDRHMGDFYEKLPTKCRHNHRQPLDHRKTIYGETNPLYNRIAGGKDLVGKSVPVMQTLGLCMYGAQNPDQWRGDICEDPVDAQRCSVYSPLVAKKALYDDFLAGVSSEEWLQANCPEILSLVWVLGVGLQVEEKPEPEPESEPEPEESDMQVLGLWQRVLEIFKPTPLAKLVPLPELPKPLQLPPPLEEGPAANLTVYVPSLEAYEDYRSGKTTDNREDSAKS